MFDRNDMAAVLLFPSPKGEKCSKHGCETDASIACDIVGQFGGVRILLCEHHYGIAAGGLIDGLKDSLSKIETQKAI